LAKAYALTAPGQPVFGDLTRWTGAEWKGGPVERFTGRRWNGAACNRLELAKSGHLPSRCVGGTPSGDSSAAVGLRHPLSFRSGISTACELFLLCMTIASDVAKQVSSATFKIHSMAGNGQCVLIKGGFILTAAHCVNWNCQTMTTAADYFLNQITTPKGCIVASALAVEPVSDIAVLGCPDYQVFEEESLGFGKICECAPSVKLLRKTPTIGASFAVWVLTHFGTWIAGTATYCGGASTFGYRTQTEIPSGTSGGPIVNDAGELVGVVSQGTNHSSAGLLSLALPAWVIARSS